MKILVLENDPKELALIQEALSEKKNTIIPIISSEQAWPYIQSGESRFLIANWDTSDLRTTQFISRARAAKFKDPVYVLTTMNNSGDDPVTSGADDAIKRPFNVVDLRNRMSMAERIISLSSNLATARTQLENQAIFDSLTNFMNQAAFLKQAVGELERARRASMPLSFIAVGIDNLKLISDSFGVKTANEVLWVLSESIREKSRPYDCIGRWSADKFILMLSGVIGADAEKVTSRIIAGVRGARIEVKNDETSVRVQVSAGIASVARISKSAEVEPLILQALQSMLRAREAGGNQVLMVYA